MSQTSTVFSQLEIFKDELVKVLDTYPPVDEGHDFPWENHVWTSPTFRRAHLDVVDARHTKRLYMLHLTVFPNTSSGAPIFGFDLIAGPNKVTGAFHDFSPIDRSHPMVAWFACRVSEMAWSKRRQLPPWAEEIFSASMVAAGNITEETELRAVLNLAYDNLRYYINNVDVGSGMFIKKQNKYCQNQKMNPHTPKVMASLGFEEDLIYEFIQKCLFPELPESG